MNKFPQTAGTGIKVLLAISATMFIIGVRTLAFGEFITPTAYSAAFGWHDLTGGMDNAWKCLLVDGLYYSVISAAFASTTSKPKLWIQSFFFAYLFACCSGLAEGMMIAYCDPAKGDNLPKLSEFINYVSPNGLNFSFGFFLALSVWFSFRKETSFKSFLLAAMILVFFSGSVLGLFSPITKIVAPLSKLVYALYLSFGMMFLPRRIHTYLYKDEESVGNEQRIDLPVNTGTSRNVSTPATAVGKTCPYCQFSIKPNEKTVICGQCGIAQPCGLLES